MMKVTIYRSSYQLNSEREKWAPLSKNKVSKNTCLST